MKVLFDNQIFIRQRHGGISRYFAELASRLCEHGVEAEFGFKYCDNHHIQELCGLLPLTSHRSGLTGWLQSAYRQHQNIRVSKGALRRDPQIVHPTYFNHQHLPENSKLVVTVYDMIHEDFLEQLKDTRTVSKKKHLCNRASRIIAISEATKQRIVDLLGIDANRVDVIPLANSLSWDGCTSRLLLPERYVLFVGRRGLYKNFITFFEAMSKLQVSDPGLHVVCTGSPFSEQELILQRERGLEDRYHAVELTDSEMSEVYGRAVAFVFPSLAEGFGLPVLEAFSCNCPVILSDIPVFREVADSAAAYFRPTCVESLAETIDRLLTDSTARRELINLGRARNNDFSWDRTAELTAITYQRALG